ncbi:uncharacterized protein [Physcomitrium patens]|uniref:VQ domain-containing protein n=1 Tax=Physcomitrium patens TaxID=3218 RepID=A0A2K1IEM1_PHYPA|nr:uncharacterized protein LOC112277387 [Physcomitrium patens]PNR27727.1 hypothetical protein PHYPA_029879 [Physcomitrium patens]|eukprot:XP_024365374.1 uncharacterized protein LOC112277387 [Physcomitrella patens]
MQNPISVRYAIAKIEGDLVDRPSTLGSGMESAAESSVQFGIRKQRERLRTSALKVGKDSHRIRKTPFPLPQVQYRPPIIIHTYSPKVIYAEPDEFMSLVQKLTGSSDTRSRLKRHPAAKKGARSDDRTIVDAADLVQQESKTTLCGSRVSNFEKSPFSATDACEGMHAMKQSDSPKSPLDSNLELDNHDLIFTIFDVKVEPSPFSFNDNSFSFFSDFNFQPASAASRVPKLHPKTDQMGQDSFNPFPGIDITSSLPTPSTMGLPDFSQSFLDCHTGASVQHPQWQCFSLSNQSPSSESAMVALENIQAFTLQ